MIDYNLCYTIPMIIKHTRDTLSETYLDAVAIRNTVFVKGQGVPRSIDIQETVSKEQVEKFSQTLGFENNRPIQDANGRKIKA